MKKLAIIFASAMIFGLSSPVMAQSNVSTVIQDGNVNTSVSVQRGSDNDALLIQDGVDNLGVTDQRAGPGGVNRAATAQRGAVNYQETEQR